MLPDWCWLLLLLLLCLVRLAWTWPLGSSSPPESTDATARVQRLLKPRTPNDCPNCRRQAPPTEANPPSMPVTPWSAIKSRRGAPKRIDTHGFACPNRSCRYYRIADAHLHALVGDGTHGKHEHIQSLRCQACGTTFSSRRDTPLYRLKTPSQRIGEVLTGLAEGLSVSAATRVFGHHHATIMTWLTRAGEHSAELHERTFRSLHLPHLQLDELRTRLRSRSHTLWLWVVVDPLSKIIPVLHLGARTQDAAHTVVHELSERLVPDCIPLFSSDGLNQYFYALTAHFGQWVAGVGRPHQWHVAAGLIYGQVKKIYRRRRLVRVRQVVRSGTPEVLQVTLQGLGLSGKLNTSFVERVNLTLRQSVAALIRRTWSTMQEAPHLLLHVEWWRAYYHFVRPHESLRVELGHPVERSGKRLPQRYRDRTPAMAAGLTSRRWTVGDLVAMPLPSKPMGTG
jgi:IS1 family transposase